MQMPGHTILDPDTFHPKSSSSRATFHIKLSSMASLSSMLAQNAMLWISKCLEIGLALDPEHSARLLQWIVAAPIVLKYQARPPVCLKHLYPTITTISHPPIIHDEIQHGFLSPPRRL